MSVCMYVCMYICMCMKMYVCMHACMYACVLVGMYACIYVCMYVCMYLCTYFFSLVRRRMFGHNKATHETGLFVACYTASMPCIVCLHSEHCLYPFPHTIQWAFLPQFNEYYYFCTAHMISALPIQRLRCVSCPICYKYDSNDRCYATSMRCTLLRV